MRLKFYPRKRERKIFMGTLLPEEKKVRNMIEDIFRYEDQDIEIEDGSDIPFKQKKTIRRNEAGL